MLNNFGFSNGGYPSLMCGYPYGTKMKHMEKQRNHVQYFDVFCNLVDLFLNVFEWEGLPETCNQRALEMSLMFNGNCLFFQHKDNGGFYHSPFIYEGSDLNFYGENTRYMTNSPLYKEHYTDENAVIIRATPVMFPIWITLDNYAARISDAMRSIDTWQRTSKRPFLVIGDKDTKLTIETILQGHTDNEWYMILNGKAFDPNAIQVVPLNVDPQSMYAYWDNLHNLNDDLLKRIGIQSARQDKAERLVSTEATANNAVTQANINYMLDSRNEGAELINSMFGLNISCNLRHEYVDDTPIEGQGETGEQEEET